MSDVGRLFTATCCHACVLVALVASFYVPTIVCRECISCIAKPRA